MEFKVYNSVFVQCQTLIYKLITVNLKKHKMHYQSGNMRQIYRESTPTKNSWERENEFHFAQRSKYEKSQTSYGQVQKSKPYQYEEQRSEKMKVVENRELVDKEVPVKIKSVSREDATTYLRVQMINSNDKGINCLNMNIIDDRNSLFLWSFFIRETDFLNLKTQQSLRVDFHGFPELITEYLCLCGEAEKEINIQEKKSAFFIVFDIKKSTEQAEFQIVEANKYKQSLHLSLRFKKANDQQLKNFLSNKFDNQKEENEMLRREISKLQSGLSDRKLQYEKLCFQFENYKRITDSKMEEFEKNEKQNLFNLREETQRKYQKKQREKDQKIKEQFESLTRDLEKLKVKNQELEKKYEKTREQKDQIELRQKKLTFNYESCKQERDHHLQELQKLRAISDTNKEKMIKVQTDNASMKARIEGLLREVENKEIIIQQSNDTKSSNTEQIQLIQSTLRQEKKKYQKLEEQFENMQSEFQKVMHKNNETENKYERKKKKIKELKDILEMQEEQLDQKDKVVRKSNEEYKILQRDYEKLQSDINLRERTIKEMKKEIQESQKRYDDQKKLLEHLNKQINERAVGIRTLGPSSYSSTLSSFPNPLNRPQISSITAESRLKYSATSPVENRDKTQRIVPPPIKRYGGTQNDNINKQKQFRDRSKSPIISRLNQQKDPEEDGERTKERIGPIKFRN